MATKIDMHSHTRGSDGIGTPAQIALAAKRAGLDALCLTDHHTNLTDEVEKVAEALRNVGVLPILGVEYSTAAGHLLIFGIDVPVKAWGMYPPMQKVIDDVLALGGACVVPHPFKGYQRALHERVSEVRGLAAVETVNGQCEDRNPETNRKAKHAAEAMRVPQCAGSDAHVPGDIGSAYTVFDAEIKTEEDFLAALKSGAFHPEADPERAAKRAAREAAWEASRPSYMPTALYTVPAPRKLAWANRVRVTKPNALQQELQFRHDAGLPLDEIVDLAFEGGDADDQFLADYEAAMAWDD